MNLLAKFPMLNSQMTLTEEVQTVNNIRLGMFTDAMNITQVNAALDELLPTLSDDEMCNFLQNLSNAYNKAKIWGEKQRKVKISIEVDEAEQIKLQRAFAKREKKAKKDLEKVNGISLVNSSTSVNSSASSASSTAKKPSVLYDPDPAINKAIKEMVAMTKNYSAAIAMLKSIGALDASYKLQENI